MSFYMFQNYDKKLRHIVFVDDIIYWIISATVLKYCNSTAFRVIDMGTNGLTLHYEYDVDTIGRMYEYLKQRLCQLICINITLDTHGKSSQVTDCFLHKRKTQNQDKQNLLCS